MSFPIDAVYLWVDGNDPRHVVSRHQHIARRVLRKNPSLRSFRFRDNNELRISLRLLHKNAPWIRRIFIVTDNQIPGWLDPDASQISIVDHRTILSEGAARPCFNSFVIESHLRHIPELAEHFIYLNDDFMIGGPAEPADFVTTRGAEKLFIGRVPSRPQHPLALLYRWLRSSSGHDRVIAWNQLLLSWSFGRWGDWRLSVHGAQLFTRTGLQALNQRFARGYARSSRYRIRSRVNVFPQLLYVNARRMDRSGPKPEAVEIDDLDFTFVMMQSGDGNCLQQLRALTSAPSKFICVNDDRMDADADKPLAEAYARFQSALAPDPAPWERAEAARKPLALFVDVSAGRENLSARFIETLTRDYRVVIVAWQDFCPRRLDAISGTRLAEAGVEVLRVGGVWDRLIRYMPVGAARLKAHLIQRAAHLLQRDLQPDIVFGAR
jgi:hypothetical protein